MMFLSNLLLALLASSANASTSASLRGGDRGGGGGGIVGLDVEASSSRIEHDEQQHDDPDLEQREHGRRPHRANRHLFEFDGTDCSDADYAIDPYYVSPTTGNNWLTTNGGWGLSEAKPFKTIQHAVDNRGTCQTIYVMGGVYRNNYYGQSYNHNNKVVNLNGVSNLKILGHTTTTAEEETTSSSSLPILEFDGPGGIFGGSASNPIYNIEIANLEIRGPNDDITYDEAMSDRLIKRKYFTGRGIAIWAGHHIYIHDMKVHHCPASGIRVNKGDYVTIADSEVYSNTWWSSSAESAIVLAEGVNVDDSEWIKMRLVNNKVYDNINKIPYYNPNYAWDYSPIGGQDCASYPACEQELIDGCPWECRYGKKTQDYIVDGMGVYVTRNKDTYLHGQMELADNVAYGNGINGVVFHRTDRGIVQRNIVYDNGIVPRLEYPEDNIFAEEEEDWHVGLGKSRQPYSGIVINNAEGVKLWSNAVSARYDDDYAFRIEADGEEAPPPLAAGGNNRACRGLIDSNLEGVVTEEADPTVCGLMPPSSSPSSPPTTPGPTTVPAYYEIECGDACHLIQWPYRMGESYPPSAAHEECLADCDDSDCKAFSLQDDYRPGNEGLRWCFLYKESQEPSPLACANDPFNEEAVSCAYTTQGGQFFITPAAKAEYNVNDLA